MKDGETGPEGKAGDRAQEGTPAGEASAAASSSFISPFSFYLGLGSNLGDREAHLRTAVRLLAERVGRVDALSAFYATEPWGFVSDHAFLNAVACVRTGLSPDEVLLRTQAIERDMGRRHKSVGGVYADRVIDIDLLLCLDADGAMLRLDTPRLTLPHPLMHLRDFVMQPLAEIAPEVAERFRPR